eukprot:4492258-Amphidinium_carterae.1
METMRCSLWDFQRGFCWKRCGANKKTKRAISPMKELFCSVEEQIWSCQEHDNIKFGVVHVSDARLGSVLVKLNGHSNEEAQWTSQWVVLSPFEVMPCMQDCCACQKILLTVSLTRQACTCCLARELAERG